MALQPTRRSFIETLRNESEILRIDEIKASEQVSNRTARTQYIAAQALESANAAVDSANAAVAAASAAQAAVALANGSTAAATAAIDAANNASAAATAATATANAQLASIARLNVHGIGAAGYAAGDYSKWNNNLGLSLSGDWTGMTGLVQLHIPILGAASNQDNRVQVRVNGDAIVERAQNETGRPLVLTHAFPMPAGPCTVEVWWYRGSTGYTDGSRHLSLLVVP